MSKVITIDQAIHSHTSPNDLRAVASWNLKTAESIKNARGEKRVHDIARLESQAKELQKVAEQLENYYGGRYD